MGGRPRWSWLCVMGCLFVYFFFPLSDDGGCGRGGAGRGRHGGDSNGVVTGNVSMMLVMDEGGIMVEAWSVLSCWGTARKSLYRWRQLDGAAMGSRLWC
ncbi:putative pollen-specific leucine-rich repeat extensin-like protein 3 [Iris pallida]|uniref:Pollen-specific leucine-rich repeat extensin-like protein 3 n=1 Tax=Iris pallida TaxID=29817 RepID=A0AAX6G0B4_IRIPA|nr:putative pollen-specific leucine-rich repeat extensin-like protein 3 [Iris pallida]